MTFIVAFASSRTMSCELSWKKKIFIFSLKLIQVFELSLKINFTSMSLLK